MGSGCGAYNQGKLTERTETLMREENGARCVKHFLNVSCVWRLEFSGKIVLGTQFLFVTSLVIALVELTERTEGQLVSPPCSLPLSPPTPFVKSSFYIKILDVMTLS